MSTRAQEDTKLTDGFGDDVIIHWPVRFKSSIQEEESESHSREDERSPVAPTRDRCLSRKARVTTGAHGLKQRRLELHKAALESCQLLRMLGRDVDVLACRREQAKRQIIGSAAAERQRQQQQQQRQQLSKLIARQLTKYAPGSAVRS